MSGFEFVFVLYSLVLGLSLVELLTGLGRALELRLTRAPGDDALRIGWLTPLLAVFVMLDLLSFWTFAWRVRDFVSVSPRMLLGVIAFASAYFLAARMVFPAAPGRAGNLDEHYFRVRRVVFAILVALVAVQWAYLASIPEMRDSIVRPASIVMTVLLVALMGAAMWVRKTAWSIALLALLIARYAVIYVL